MLKVYGVKLASAFKICYYNDFGDVDCGVRGLLFKPTKTKKKKRSLVELN